MTPSATPENYTTLTDVTWGQLTSARAARHWAAVNDNLTESASMSSSLPG